MWEWFIHLPRCHNLGRHEYTAWKQYVICLPTTHGGLHSLPGFQPSPKKKVSFWHSSLVSSLVGLLAIAWPVQATSCENHCARIVPTWWPKMGCSSQSGRKYGKQNNQRFVFPCLSSCFLHWLMRLAPLTNSPWVLGCIDIGFQCKLIKLATTPSCI